jgi:dTDP-4-dehydrorhamnose reductase
MIWIIGNAGMLGREIEVFCQTSNIPYVASDREVDICQPQALKDFYENKNIQWIINCSAYTAVDKAEEEKGHAYHLNCIGVGNIARVARRDTKIIHFSTDYVFDGEKDTEYFEDDKPNPINFYGESKLFGEYALGQEYNKHFIIRVSRLFGRYRNNFVLKMLNLMKNQSILKVIDNQFGGPTYTKDITNGIFKIIDSDSEAYGIYHFSNRENTNWFEYTKVIYR